MIVWFLLFMRNIAIGVGMLVLAVGFCLLLQVLFGQAQIIVPIAVLLGFSGWFAYLEWQDKKNV